MNISELTPDLTVATLLSNKVVVQLSASKTRKVVAYAQGQMPQSGQADEFITAIVNGKVSSYTQPIGIYRGNVAITLYCKCNADGTIKRKRMSSLIAQCVEAINGVSADGFYFGLDATNVIVPMTTNLTNGYSTTTLNVEWRTQY